MNNSTTIVAQVNESKILDKISNDMILERAKEIRANAPKKERSQLSINRSGINTATKGVLMSFDIVYKHVRRDHFNLSNRCTISNVLENQDTILSKLFGLSSTTYQSKLRAKDTTIDLTRISQVLTNKALFVCFMTKSQRVKLAEEKKPFSLTNVIDILAKILTMSESNFDRVVSFRELTKKRTKYANLAK